MTVSPRRILDGLIAAGEIDDLETSRAQRRCPRFENALLIWPAMGQRPCGILNPAGMRRVVPVRVPGDPTHSATLDPEARVHAGIAGHAPPPKAPTVAAAGLPIRLRPFVQLTCGRKRLASMRS